MEKELKEIMEEIVNRKGLLSSAARMYLNDEENARQFVLEIKEQVPLIKTHKMWDEELIKHIEVFCDGI
ncbi:MAG TPA: hypothetical protein VNZ49_17745 [Bacteroidia bacterium]|jgi:hypothetical protein|nr:hypothetical protein [Bacteroidia bacterium]